FKVLAHVCRATGITTDFSWRRYIINTSICTTSTASIVAGFFDCFEITLTTFCAKRLITGRLRVSLIKHEITAASPIKSYLPQMIMLGRKIIKHFIDIGIELSRIKHSIELFFLFFIEAKIIYLD